ncbi:uncharacterized protein B0H18DRAFT_1006447 [Fomitopsis serialis]|uniref:uncharacterized protein n=1 Tax=Fomitopsis serialis TaxID=139415 RepID=UPI002007E445|nr:uncharacterized protein B0H18DRAFT_1006447 [Neoantrodia serialis]KAH9926500.1 hypothetical protein B0H18DRAFT_1006447 [Neoantrodia serialis]
MYLSGLPRAQCSSAQNDVAADIPCGIASSQRASTNTQHSSARLSSWHVFRRCAHLLLFVI